MGWRVVVRASRSADTTSVTFSCLSAIAHYETTVVGRTRELAHDPCVPEVVVPDILDSTQPRLLTRARKAGLGIFRPIELTETTKSLRGSNLISSDRLSILWLAFLRITLYLQTS